MSVITSLSKQAANLTQKALRLGGDFVHPVSDDSGNTPDYNDPDTLVSTDDHIDLPHTAQWGQNFLSTTFLDPETGLLTTKTEGNPPLDDGMSIYDIYADRAERMGDEPLYTYKENGEWITKTGNEVLAEIRETAKGLLHYGLRKGDGVAFMCRTSYQWDIFDAAVMACGGVLATIYDTDSAEQIRNIVNNSDARLLVVETKDMRDKADGAEDECPTLEHIVCFETHEHYCTTALNLPEYMPDLLRNSRHTVLLFLPQAHSFARAINYICVASQLHIYIAQGIKTLITDLQVAKPTVMIVVPRVLEKVYNAASQKAGHGAKGVAFAAAVVAAQNYMKEVSAKGKAGALAKARRTAFDPMVYASLREVLGGRAKWIVAGGAPLDPELMAFFRGANVPVYEGYGLTETTAPCAFNPVGVPYHQGSVGIAFPGFELRIAEDDEIQVRGTAVFPRYHKNEEASEDSFVEDGWYATGDLGRIDDDGFLYIIGRKKDLIITAGGKNVSPGPIEEVIQRCEFVSQALVLGDKRPFISALITLDEESLRPWLESKGLNRDMPLEEAANNAAVRAEVQKWVDQANEGVSRAESVRKFIILPEEFTQENGLMTASMKVIRPKVIKRYSTLLNTQMYTKKK